MSYFNRIFYSFSLIRHEARSSIEKELQASKERESRVKHKYLENNNNKKPAKEPLERTTCIAQETK